MKPVFSRGNTPGRWSTRFRRSLLSMITMGVLLVFSVGVIMQRAPSARAATCTDQSYSALLVPTCGAWWGVYADPDPDNNPGAIPGPDAYWSAMKTVENTAGRKFNIIRRYHFWNDTFPDSAEVQAVNGNRQGDTGGRILSLAWQSQLDSTGTTGPLWSAIAAGTYDARIRQVADNIKAFGHTVFFDFDQEPEGRMDPGQSQASQPKSAFVAAYQHVHTVFGQEGATNVVWVWSVMGWLGWANNGSNSGTYDQIYPGDQYVDWIAWDPYNKGPDVCGNSWIQPADVFSTFYNWLHGANQPAGAQSWHGNKPEMLTEFGTNEKPSDGGQAKATWFNAVPGALQALPDIKAAIYFNKNYQPLTNKPGSVCTRWKVDTTPASAQAYASAGMNPYLHPVAPCGPTPAPTPTSMALNRTGWVASSFPSNTAPDVPANALDGNLSTFWSTEADQVPGQFFEVNMQQSQSFNQIMLDAAGRSSTDSPTGYQVFASNDGVNWGGVIASGTSNGTALTTVTFPMWCAQYIKVVQTGSSPGNWWSIAEFNVYQ